MCLSRLPFAALWSTRRQMTLGKETMNTKAHPICARVPGFLAFLWKRLPVHLPVHWFVRADQSHFCGMSPRGTSRDLCDPPPWYFGLQPNAATSRTPQAGRECN
jgi:hypothetical protein